MSLACHCGCTQGYVVFRVVIWPLLATLFFSAAALATQPDPLRIAVSRDSYPYQYQNAEGQPAGYLVDFWRRWSQQTGHPVEFSLKSWPQSISALQQGDVDLHAGLAQSPSREEKFALSDPLLTVPLKLFVHRDLPDLAGLNEVTPYRIGVVARSIHEELLLHHLPDPALVRYPSRDALLNAALTGEVQVFTNLDGYLQRSDRQSQVSRLYPAYKRLSLAQIPVSAALPKAHAERLPELNRSLALLDSNVREVLSRRWLGQSDPQAPLKIGVISDMPPLMYTGEGGRASGLLVDLWRAWSMNSGVEVQFIPAGLGPAGLTALQQGELDLFAGHVAAEVGKLGLEKAYELHAVNSVLVTHGDDAQALLANPEAALGVYANAGYESWLSGRYPGRIRFTSDRPKELLAKLQQHKVDGVLLPAPLLPPLPDSLIASPMASPEVAMNVLVATGDQALAERVKRGFADLPAQQVAALKQYWDSGEGTGFHGSIGRPLVTDTTPWLVNRTETPDWAWQALELDQALNQLGRILGVILRVGGEAERNDDSALQLRMAAVPSPLEAASRPLMMLNYLLISEDRITSPSAVNTLRQPLVLLGNSPAAAWVREHYPSLAVKRVRDRAQALTALEEGGALLISAAQWRSWEVTQPQLNFAVPSNPPRIGLYLDLPPKMSQWHEALNQGMSVLDWQGTRPGMADMRPASAGRTVAVWFAALVILTLAVGYIMLYRQWRWEQLQRRQLLTQQNARDGFDSVTGLPGRSMLDDRLSQALLAHGREHRQMAVLVLDLDGFGQLNRRLGWDKGDKLLAMVANRWRTGLRRSDTLARLQGDQFVAILNQVKNVAAARHVAEMLMMELEQPFELDGKSIQLSASIGVAVFPQHGADPVSLLQAADLQLRLVKGQGGAGYQVA
nr:transporter substrate-binding domain-containing protein [Ferrimonas balearica]